MSSDNGYFWSQAELDRLGHCPVCSSKDTSCLHTGISDKVEGVPGEWTVYQCGKCQCCYLDPRPSVDSIGKAYGSYYTHSDPQAEHEADNGRSLLWRLVNGYLNYRYGARRNPALSLGRWLVPLWPPLRQQLDYFFRKLPDQGGRLLDVGCGNGRFLLRALQAGWEVNGLEPDIKAARAAQVAGLTVAVAGFESLQGRADFDVVTCSHVIEHVHQPLELLIRMLDQLRPGGQLWLATPNAQSIGHRVFKANWRGLEPPRHMQLLSARALRGLLEQAGFRDISFQRRGRGAGFVFNASRVIARTTSTRHFHVPVILVDLLASLSFRLSEELVVVARKSE